MRIKALESLDKMLALAFDQRHRSYKLLYPLREENFNNNFPSLSIFPLLLVSFLQIAFS